MARQEITGFADAAGSALGRHSVKAALAKFAAGERLEGPVNTTRAKAGQGLRFGLGIGLRGGMGWVGKGSPLGGVLGGSWRVFG